MYHNIYLKMKWDDKTGKKKTYFGKKWGELPKEEANASAIKTGDGLVVIDIDTKKLDEVDSQITKWLPDTPTVETARGYHYYFKDKKSSDFINKAKYSDFVDVRSDGGIIFTQYLGKSKHISYKRVGNVNKKIPKKLRKYLLSCMEVSSKRVKNRVQWEQIEKGEINDGTIRYAVRDFKSGCTFDEVIANGLAYVEKYLNGTQREIRLMMSRVKWAYEKHLEDKMSEDDEVADTVIEDDEVLAILKKAQKQGALKLEKTMLEIKEREGISIGTQREMLKESPDNGVDSIQKCFAGEVIWDSALGLFAEVRDKCVIYYKKNGFVQTVMSKSGWMTSTDVGEKLYTIPHKFLVYQPMSDEGELFTKNGDIAINTYRGVDLTVEGKFTVITKVLDNLFINQPVAKEAFINWMANIVQTGKRTGIAWGFFGASGTGKGFIVDVFAKILGLQNCSLNISDTDLQSNFNGYLHNKQFVHLNEIASDFHGRHGVAGKIKAFVSDPYLQINQKFMNEIVVENYTNTILNSNRTNPLELDTDDRRWNMIVTDKSLTTCDWWKGDKTYQKGIKQSLAFGNYLKNRPLKTVKLLPMNSAKESVIEQTVSPFEIVGNAIKRGNADEILELLDDDLLFSDDEIKQSCIEKRWTNELLNSIYMWLTGKKDVKGLEAQRYFIKPYISTKRCIFKRGKATKRGYTL